MNCSLEEYASDIVYQIKNICDCAGIECPDIISESGRASVAHYSMLVTNVQNNFSLFQSLPDSWAIDQLFPIMPIQRLDQKPDITASVADLTCDSDGEVTSFVGEKGRTDFLPLHRVASGEKYYLGFFLIGAYQEILGDLHNLFGDTNAVHITFSKKSHYRIDMVINGDTISSSLKYVQYDSNEMVRQIRDNLEKKVELGSITIEESSRFLELIEKNLQSYTYLGE